MPRPERQLEDAMYLDVIPDVLETQPVHLDNFTSRQTHVDRVSVHCVIQRPYVFVRVNYDGQRSVVGFSKVMHPDEWNEEKGIKIAVRRAIRALFKSPTQERKEQ